MYTAIVLNSTSKEKLLNKLGHLCPTGWKIYAHHMTINMGKISNGPCDKSLLDTSVALTVISIGSGPLVTALGVETEIHSVNKVKHITLAVDIKNFGKPFMSNKIEKWAKLKDSFKLKGTILEMG